MKTGLLTHNAGRFLSLWGAGAAIAALLAACAETQLVIHTAKSIAREGKPGETNGTYKVGQPYKVGDVWYYPAVDYGYRATGVASWYGREFHGRPTANGETFDMNGITAAHRTLPLPSMVQVTNLENGRAIRVRVNDRGPFAHGRLIDLSRRAAQLLGFYRKGTAKVRVDILPDESRQLALLYGAGAGKQQLAQAEDGGPSKSAASGTPPVKAAPRVPVTRAPLPAAGQSPDPPVPAESPMSKPVVRAAAVADIEPRADGQVTQEPVRPANLYIQAGTFAQFDNAHRLKARLSVLGPTRVNAIMLDDQPLFRVRIGPIRSVARADRILERMIASGYTDAQTIVDR